MKKTKRLKQMLFSQKTEYIMEAHNALSGKVVEESGFKGIWGGGLSISAAMGVRDNNEASWTEVLDVVEHMCDATNIPILLDADTGYGNFNNARRLIRKLEQVGVGAVCIEDKLFPKMNSFINGEKQPLADIDEYCGKIKAIKDTQKDPDFCMIARTEAFITGWGLAEALKRAEAYYRAGADGIFVHSKMSTPVEILAFIKEWQNTCPVVIAPTMYSATPREVFEKAGISIVIWANYMLRACITYMQQIARKIYLNKSVAGAETEVVPLKEIFRLQEVDELKEAEKKYLPKKKAIC
jgi:phosphoenolpyruvate phosphomutase